MKSLAFCGQISTFLMWRNLIKNTQNFSKIPSTYYSRNFSPCSIFTDWIWKVKIFAFSLLLLSLSRFLSEMRRWGCCGCLGGGGLRVARELGCFFREKKLLFVVGCCWARERTSTNFIRKKIISHNLQFHPREKKIELRRCNMMIHKKFTVS